MGRYSDTKLAHGTHGSPQITMDEKIYSSKVDDIIKNLKIDSEYSNDIKKTGNIGKKELKQIKNKNILREIINLIISMGYQELEINNIIMYTKNGIILKVVYVEEYDYYILEKTEEIANAKNNIFELLASISNEIKPNMILQTIKNILLRLNCNDLVFPNRILRK